VRRRRRRVIVALLSSLSLSFSLSSSFSFYNSFTLIVLYNTRDPHFAPIIVSQQMSLIKSSAL
jgi:hypothetical protein